MDGWKYYQLLRRWRWLVLVTTLAAIAVGVVYQPLPAGKFAATATLSVPSERRSMFLVSGLPPETGSVRDASAFALLRSRDLSERVVRQYHFDIRPEDLRRRLTVSKDQGTDLIRVTVTGRTPGEAIALTNAVVETAAAYDQETQSRAGTLAREFVEKQVQDARAALRKAEDALLSFQQTRGSELTSSKGQQLASLQSESQRVALSLSQVEAKLALTRGQMGQASATRTDQEISDNPIAQRLRGDLVGLEVALTSELALHTEKYPSVTALKAKIEAVKARLAEELQKTVSKERTEFNPIYDALIQSRISLEAEKAALLAEVEAIRRTLASIRRELPGLEQLQLEQSRLSRNVDILGRQYADLEGRLAQARLKEQEVQDLGSLAVASPAGAPHPTSPWNTVARLIFAAVLGLAGGGAIAFSLEYLDNTLRTPENAERLLGVPVLAAIPRHNPPFDEAYRLLRVNVAARGNKRKPDVIAIMSPRPREGTSTVVANLALAFARAGRHVIVVDAALQRPTQHEHFKVSNERGLVDILAGDATLDSVLSRTYVPNLWVMPSGKIAEPTSGLLVHEKVATLFADLRTKADLILVDTPPGVFADAFVVASLATGVLLVLDARQSPRGVEEHVKAQLDRLGARIFGAVLTKVRRDLVPEYDYQDELSETGAPRGLTTATATMILLMLLGAIAGAAIVLGTPHTRDEAVGLMRAVVQWTSFRLFGSAL